MITFIELIAARYAEQARVTLETARVQLQLIQEVMDTCEPTLRVLERDAAHDAVHLVAEPEQVLREITAVLPGDTGDQRTLGHFSRGSSSCSRFHGAVSRKPARTYDPTCTSHGPATSTPLRAHAGPLSHMKN